MQDKWQRVSLEYIADIIDPQPDHRAPRFVEGGFSYIGIGDIDPDGHIRHEQCRKVSEAAVAKQERAFIIEYEDIAFGKVGTVGKVVYLKEQGRYAVSATLVIIKPKDNVNRHFLFHLLQSHQTAENILYRQTGTTRATLGIQQIRIFEYFIPLLLAEQKRIAEILDTLDEAIAHTSSLITKLKYIKAGLLNDLLTRGLDENGELRDAIAHPEQFKDSPLGRIPKGWEVLKLESVLNGRPKNGYSPKEVDEWTGTLMLGLSCLTEEGFEPCQLKNAPLNDPKVSNAILHDGDFLLSRSNTRERVALVGIYRDIGVPCIYPDLMMRLSVHEKTNPRFLELILQHFLVRRQLTSNAQGTSGSMVKISSQTVIVAVIALPDPIEQARIIHGIDQHDTRIRTEETYLNKLKLQKKGLIHDLLTGKIRVNQVKNNVAIPTTA